MKKKFLVGMITLLCITSLVACGKKEEENTSAGTPNGGYAVNEVRQRNNDADDAPDTDTTYNDNGQVYTDPANNNGSTYTDNNGNVIAPENKNGNSTTEQTTAAPTVDNEAPVFKYPKDANGSFTVNGVEFGQVIPYSFMYGDTAMNTKSDKLEDIQSYSIKNKVYAQKIGFNVELSDLAQKADGNYQSIYLTEKGIDKITIGKHSYALKDLLYKTDDFDSLWNLMNKNYENVKSGSKDESVYEVHENEDHGFTYTWRFMVDDTDGEYADADKPSSDYRGHIDLVMVTGNSDRIKYYKLNYFKTPHNWKYETQVHKLVVIEPEEVDPETGETIKEAVEEVQWFPSGEYDTFQDGYCYNKANMTFTDGTVLGLNNFAITIHSPSAYSEDDGISINYEIK